MDFGRLPSLQGVSFEVPALPERSRRVLAANARALAAAGERCDVYTSGRGGWLRTGAPAWARKDWIGKMYPRKTADRAMLRAYGERLTAIELNASYYRVPTEETLDAWAREVPDGFQFCPKVHQSISHRRALSEAVPEALDFAHRFLRLGSKLGPALLQLPPWMDVSALPELEALVAELPGELRVAVEMRHPSWFDRGALRDDVFMALERRGAGAVITDVAGRRDVCHSSLPAPFALIRFVGNGAPDRGGLHPTDLPRAEAWIARLAEWRALGLEDAYLFAHQPDDALAPEVLSHLAAAARALGVSLPSIPLDGGPLDSPPAGPSPRKGASGAPAAEAQLDLFGGPSRKK